MEASEPTVDFANRTFSVNEAASYLKISRAMLYKLMADGRLVPSKLGARTVFVGAELQKLLNASRAA